MDCPRADDRLIHVWLSVFGVLESVEWWSKGLSTLLLI